MLSQYRKGPDGQYTLKKSIEKDGVMVPTVSAHPGMFIFLRTFYQARHSFFSIRYTHLHTYLQL